jgi:hypothetical protein
MGHNETREVTCPSCYGSGKKEGQCPVCGGLRSSDYHSCYRCNGSGRIEESCGACSGTGRQRQDVWVNDDGSSSSDYSSSSLSSPSVPNKGVQLFSYFKKLYEAEDYKNAISCGVHGHRFNFLNRKSS